MQYYDQHLHTYFSPDSNEQFENYLKQSDVQVVTTEHLDFYRPKQQLKNVILDYDGYTDTIHQLNEKYNGRLLKGIEVGYTHVDRYEIQNYMGKKTFDIVLLSIHHNGQHGFMHLNHDIKPIESHLDEYFGLMLQAVENAPQANILAHFDFGLRGYDEVSLEYLLPFEEVLMKIMQNIISNNQALELNTRSMYRYNNAHLYDYIIGLYKSLGGEMFTVSSDAHMAEDYELHFADAFSMLEHHGVDKLVVFQQQEPQFVDLPVISKK